MREVKGRRHSLNIVNWLKELGAWWRDDETPWCGTFVAHCLKSTNRGVPKHWYRAKAYEKYGTLLSAPAYGCIGVMSRRGGGHVCFVIGETKDGKRLVVIGGNQNDSVCVTSYPRSRFTAFVWASRDDGTLSVPYEYRYQLPVYDQHNLNKVVSEA
ncbi:MAG: TIGR02594 family protein [Proteobacteria bacterium]|nr:MAG: TIGR02594 family protein [Pseudomonadota bacterium]